MYHSEYTHLGSQLHPVILSLPSVHQDLEAQVLPVIKNINIVMALSPLKEHYLMFTARGKLKLKTAL